jgi:hypothetical protein
MVFAGDTFESKPTRLSWNSWKATEEGKRSPEFNLRGLAAGLEKTLVGALLAGALSLKLQFPRSTFRSWENPLKKLSGDLAELVVTEEGKNSLVFGLCGLTGLEKPHIRLLLAGIFSFKL